MEAENNNRTENAAPAAGPQSPDQPRPTFAQASALALGSMFALVRTHEGQPTPTAAPQPPPVSPPPSTPASTAPATPLPGTFPRQPPILGAFAGFTSAPAAPVAPPAPPPPAPAPTAPAPTYAPAPQAYAPPQPLPPLPAPPAGPPSAPASMPAPPAPYVAPAMLPTGWAAPGFESPAQPVAADEPIAPTEPAVRPDATPEIIPEPAPEIVPQVTPEIVPDVAPEIIPQIAPDTTPDIAPQITPEIAPEPAPEIAPQFVPDVTPEIIPEIPPSRPEAPSPDIAPEIAPEITPEIAPDPWAVESELPVWAPAEDLHHAPSYDGPSHQLPDADLHDGMAFGPTAFEDPFADTLPTATHDELNEPQWAPPPFETQAEPSAPEHTTEHAAEHTPLAQPQAWQEPEDHGSPAPTPEWLSPSAPLFAQGDEQDHTPTHGHEHNTHDDASAYSAAPVAAPVDAHEAPTPAWLNAVTETTETSWETTEDSQADDSGVDAPTAWQTDADEHTHEAPQTPSHAPYAEPWRHPSAEEPVFEEDSFEPPHLPTVTEAHTAPADLPEDLPKDLIADDATFVHEVSPEDFSSLAPHAPVAPEPLELTSDETTIGHDDPDVLFEEAPFEPHHTQAGFEAPTFEAPAPAWIEPPHTTDHQPPLPAETDLRWDDHGDSDHGHADHGDEQARPAAPEAVQTEAVKTNDSAIDDDADINNGWAPSISAEEQQRRRSALWTPPTEDHDEHYDENRPHPEVDDDYPNWNARPSLLTEDTPASDDDTPLETLEERRQRWEEEAANFLSTGEAPKEDSPLDFHGDDPRENTLEESFDDAHGASFDNGAINARDAADDHVTAETPLGHNAPKAFGRRTTPVALPHEDHTPDLVASEDITFETTETQEALPSGVDGDLGDDADRDADRDAIAWGAAGETADAVADPVAPTPESPAPESATYESPAHESPAASPVEEQGDSSAVPSPVPFQPNRLPRYATEPDAAPLPPASTAPASVTDGLPHPTADGTSATDQWARHQTPEAFSPPLPPVVPSPTHGSTEPGEKGFPGAQALPSPSPRAQLAPPNLPSGLSFRFVSLNDPVKTIDLQNAPAPAPAPSPTAAPEAGHGVGHASLPPSAEEAEAAERAAERVAQNILNQAAHQAVPQNFRRHPLPQPPAPQEQDLETPEPDAAPKPFELDTAWATDDEPTQPRRTRWPFQVAWPARLRKLFSLGIALVLVGGGVAGTVYAIRGSGTASAGVISAPLVTLYSANAGQVSKVEATAGQELEPGRHIMTIQGQHPDSTVRDDLASRLRAAQERGALLDQQTAELERVSTEVKARRQDHVTQSQLDQIRQRLNDIRGQRSDIASEAGNLQRALTDEEVRLAGATPQQIEADRASILWTLLATDGMQVTRGTPVAQIADCGHLFIEPRANAQGLTPGSVVRVKLDGSHGMIVGRVRTEAQSVPGAAGSDAAHQAHRLVVDVSSNVLQQTLGTTCPIGREVSVEPVKGATDHAASATHGAGQG